MNGLARVAQDLLELGNMDVLFLAGAYNSGHIQEEGTMPSNKANTKTKIKGAKSKAKALKQSELLAGSSSSSSSSAATTNTNSSSPATQAMLLEAKAKEQVAKSVAAAVAAAKTAAAAAASTTTSSSSSSSSGATGVENEAGIEGFKTAAAGGEGRESGHLQGGDEAKKAPQADTVVVVRSQYCFPCIDYLLAPWFELWVLKRSLLLVA